MTAAHLPLITLGHKFPYFFENFGLYLMVIREKALFARRELSFLQAYKGLVLVARLRIKIWAANEYFKTYRGPFARPGCNLL